ncbi:response regulator [Robbsia andropogonis]|uniref:response regulator n=1 Tax=Robbsia andropogonis TaxID=28092 RepID=UPI0004652D8B|nr:response regulator [Robbsia andropogonis]
MADSLAYRPPKAKLVIVDDESLIVESLAFVLEDEGYEVYAASNGRAALDLIKAVLPALVITDFMMPVMSGQELAEALKSDPLFATIPVILASAVQSDQARKRQDLFDAVFDKPYRLPLLIDTVASLLQRQSSHATIDGHVVSAINDEAAGLFPIGQQAIPAFQFSFLFQGRHYRVLVTDDFLNRHADALSVLGGRDHILSKYRKTFEAIAIGKILRGDEEPVRVVGDDLAPKNGSAR